jgi:hypothetical protein
MGLRVDDANRRVKLVLADLRQRQRFHISKLI